MRAHGRRGFTLLELMIAVLIALILVAGTYRLFIAQSRAVETSQAVSEMQDNARTAMDFLVRDIRQAGFLIASNNASSGNQPLGAIRIENNCGASTTGGQASPNFKISATYGPTLGGSTSVNAGDIVGDTTNGANSNEACPGGSDRLMIVFRPRPDYLLDAGGVAGASLHLLVGCLATGPTTYDCNTPFTTGQLNTTCGGGCSSSPTMMCNQSDPNDCRQVWLQPQSGGPGCNGSTCTAANTNSTCRVDIFTGAGCSGPFTTPADWGTVGGKGNASFNGYTFRTYQLLDLDNDGSTELVYSDDVQGAELSASGTVKWTVVANDIDDLQFAYETKKHPGVYNSGTLLNFGTGNCTEGAATAYTPNEKDPECMTNLYTNSDYPTSLRVSIVARTAKKVLAAGTESVINAYRTQVEDNLPAAQAFNGATPNWTASGNGNAQGYQRRTLTEVVSLRNLAGFNF